MGAVPLSSTEAWNWPALALGTSPASWLRCLVQVPPPMLATAAMRRMVLPPATTMTTMQLAARPLQLHQPMGPHQPMRRQQLHRRRSLRAIRGSFVKAPLRWCY